MARARQNLLNICATILCAMIPLWQYGPAPAQALDFESSEIDKIAARKVDAIVNCLKDGYEAVLLPKNVLCQSYRTGSRKLPADMPFKEDVKTICDPNNKNAALDDFRVLPGNVVKMIAERQSSRYGIRILGAIFCDRLDLVGLELPYALVTDYSIFRWGIDARNFRTHGDLSFDNSLILDELRVTRSRIDGTIFASNAFINEVEILDSKIGGSLLFRRSVLFKPAVIDTVGVSGELSMRYGLFPYFLLQFSKVGSVLDLSFSQASCAYGIRQSEIGEFVAVGSGFGASTAGDQSDKMIAAARKVLPDDKKSCSYPIISPDQRTFRVSDVKVKSSLCFREFRWPSDQTSNIQFNDVNVIARASIRLEPIGSAGSKSDDAKRNSGDPTRKVEFVSLQADSLVFNFAGFGLGHDPYQLSMDGLKLEHVYGTDDDCKYDPDFARPQDAARPPETPSPESFPGISFSKPTSGLGWPGFGDVTSWLNANSLATTQPYAAFIDVFQKNGADNEARDLRGLKASAELCLKRRHLFGDCLSWGCSIKAADVSTPDYNPLTWIADLVAVVLGLGLAAIADHGYHPEWVGWWVLLALLISFLYFRRRLKIVGLEAEGTDTIRPARWLFLFDRLLPIYQISEDHYHIEAFYKLAPDNRGIYRTMRRWGANVGVVRVNESERRRAERCLLILKAVGAVLAIFLLAAINALVSR
jgi:hypothetical protein